VTRRRRSAVISAVVVLLAGCGGSGDDRPDLAPATQTTERSETTAPSPAEPAPSAESASSTAAGTAPLPARARDELELRMAEAGAAIGRWDDELAECIGPSGEADDSSATCTHAAWERLVFQMDVALYYLLPYVRELPRATCHDALSVEVDALRAFWNGAAPLNLAWLDQQQRPPSRFDLELAVDLVRPVPVRIREALASACAA